ncbi:hypothetical protein EPUS_01267 [Endocarpon pusillum Z07020]|uniref:HOOK N-terminal domain-containing protein n=1 Tax=Endocarpon pusillum (strain Z07020 / HMAS-L-300199) TaxID=1263415 RepID=U1GV27_ENDPU|nr:uncharacterized protein EPUS_01267 [Endocarpon pusillum Z07020]ERF75901.1 hypothetical protein EPUS_01267 [Endocarpon pusillum Z07020]
MAEGEVVLPALLQWFNSLRAQKVRSLSELSSGVVLWEVLHDIDPEAFADELPLAADEQNPLKVRNVNLTNLKHIYEILKTYIVERCKRKLPLPSGEPDLEAIAQSISEKDVIQLLKLVLLAAVFGRLSLDYIQQLIYFSEDAQAQFYLVLHESEAIEVEEDFAPSPPDASMGPDDDRASPLSENGPGKEPGLVYEERIAELVAANKGLEHKTVELEEQLENMHDLHTKLQKNYDNLEIQQKDTAERLDALRSGKGEQSILGIQRTKMQQQETIIATLETQLTSLQEENNNLKIQTELLQSQSAGFQQMQDDLYELKLDREQLQRKANAADKYKQKLQSLQKADEENESLKYRVGEMQRQLKECDSEQLNVSDLRRENDEYRQLVSNIEQQLIESNEAKKRAEFENMKLAAKAQQADDQASRWHLRAEELQTMFNENRAPESPTTPRAPLSNGLGLTASEDGSPSVSNLSEEMASAAIDDSNMISEDELQSIIRIMKEHNKGATNAEKTSSIQEQQKLAAKIENSRATTKALSQVIDLLTQPRVSFVGVKELDGSSPYKPVSPHIDDLASVYGVASQSARSSVTSLSAASRRSSAASFHSVQSSAKNRRTSVLRGLFRSLET